MAQPPPPPPMAMNPVGTQPGEPPVNWMPAPQVAAPQGCPPGLEYLTQVDQLFVHQIVNLLETVCGGVELTNRYAIKNSLGQQVYFAHKESGFCMRFWCGSQRGFIFHITDNSQQEVMRLVREFKCCAGCGCCANSDSCSFEVKVEAPVGNVVGYVKQSQYYLGPKFDILDAERRPVVKIKGPYCMCQDICCQGDIEFDVFTGDMATTIGKVFKHWPGCCKAAWTDADNFGVTFPADLHVNVKATLLAAVFLIDIMFFEGSQQNNS